MNGKKTTMGLAVLLAALTLAPAARAKDVDRTIPVQSGTTIGLEMIAGKVTVEAWDRNEVSITGTINDRYEELQIAQHERSLDIEVNVRDGNHEHWGESARLDIRVPRDSNLQLETISADLAISGCSGRVTVETVSGGVTIEGDRLDLTLSSVSGDVRVEADTLAGVDYESVSGSATFEGALADGDFDFELVSGTLTLIVPAGTSASYDIETFSGRIDNEFGPEAVRTSQYVPAKELKFSEGGGAASVSIENFSGTVHLRSR